MDAESVPVSNDDFIDFLCASWRLTSEEYNYISENATDEEFEAIAWCADIGQKRMAITAVKRLLRELTEHHID